jgi:hypothetical protein
VGRASAAGATLFAAVLAGLAAVAAPRAVRAGEVPTHIGALDEQGRPVAGAEVVEARPGADGYFVHDDGAPLLAVTGSGGAVSTLPAVSHRDARVVVRAPGRAAVLLPAVDGGAAAALWPAAPLSGSLRTPEKTPAAGATVLALPVAEGADLAHRTRSDESGAFAFAHLVPGRWRLRVARADGQFRELGTVVAPGTLGTFSLERGAMLRGRVLDGDTMKPVVGLPMSLRRLAGPTQVAAGGAPVFLDDAPATEARTEADGRILFPDVPPGIYEARIGSPGLLFDGEAPRVEVEEPRVHRLETWWVMRRVAVTGRVLDVEKRPIPGASVVVAPVPGPLPPDGGWAPIEPVTARADGSFRVEGVAPAEGYRLVAWAKGYAPAALEDVDVDRGSDTDVQWITLKQPWSVEVTVTDLEGKPVADAAVETTPDARPDPEPDDLVSRAMVASAETGPDGKATVAGLPDGDAVLRVSKPGYVDATLVVPEPVKSNVRAVRASLSPTAAIEGRVFAADGPVPPVLVRAVVRRSGLVREVAPAPDGTFRLDDLPPWPTDVEALPASGRPALVLARREAVTPGSGEPVSLEVPVARAVAGTVSGIATAEGSAPAVVRLETARLDVERDEFAWTVAAETPLVVEGGSGTFAFPGVPPGVYAVRAGQGLRETGPVLVRVEDRDLEGVALALPRPARVSGVVYDAATRAARLGALVALVRLEADGERTAPAPPPPEDARAAAAAAGRSTRVVGEDGAYAFEDVAPGLWRVEAYDRDVPPAAEVVRVAEGEAVRAPDLVITAGGTIEGVVRDDARRGLAGVAVRIFALPGRVEQPRAVTRDDGTFRSVGLGAGWYRVQAGRDTPGFSRAPALDAEVEVVEGEVTAIELGATGRGRIDGTVRRRGKVVAGAAVEALLEGACGCDAVVLHAITGGDGRYRWDGLPPGRYALYLEDGTVRSAATVDLADGDRVTQDLDLEEGRLVGRVVTAAGDPVGGAEVLASAAAGCECAAVGRARTAPDGRFTLAGLPVGPYRLEVAPMALPARVVEPVLAEVPGSERPVEVVVGAGASLDLRVVDVSRRGVTAAEVWVETPSGVALHRRPFFTGPGGFLKVDGLPEGPARIAIHAKGLGRPLPRPVALKEGVPARVETTLRPATAIVLTVTAGRDPLSRARVDLLYAHSDVAVERRRTLGRSVNEWGVTPRTGVLTIGDLEEGDYVLVVDAGSAFDVVRMPVRVRGRDPVEVRVEMPVRER